MAINSLRAKTVLSALLPTAVMLMVVAVIALYAYEGTARDVVLERDTELAKISAARLAEGLSQYSRVLQSVAATEDLGSMESARLGSALERAQNQLYVFDAGVVVYDMRGVALWSQPFASARRGTRFPLPSEFDKIRRTLRPAFSSLFEDAISGREVSLVGVPILGTQGEFKGVLAAMFTIRYPLLGPIDTEVLRLKAGSSGYAFLVDGNGEVIYHPDGAQVGRELAATEPVKRATRGEIGALLAQDSAGQTMVSSFAPVPGIGWGLVIQERWDSVVGPIRGYSRLLLALLVAGGLVSGGLIFFAVGRSLKPIKDLTWGARRIASGDFDHAITTKCGGEIEALAEQFNAMAGALKESYEELEQRVAARTAELSILHEIALTVSKSLNMDEVLHAALDSTLKVLNMETGAAFRLEHESQTLVLVAHRGLSEEFVRYLARLPLAAGAAGQAASESSTVVMGVASYADGEHKERVEKEGLRLVVSVPLLAKGRTLGVVNASTRTLGQPTPEQLSLLPAIGRQLGVAVENARLYEQAEQSAVAAERTRLARDLHDAVTQTLFSASLIAEVLPRLWDHSPDEGHRRLEELRQLTRGALAEMRTLLVELRPTALTEVPLGDLLRQLAEALTGRARLPVSLTLEGQRSLPAEVQVALYRIAQEALNNVAKHSGASRASVSLRYEPECVELCVSDDGHGFDKSQVPAGRLGLGIMRERAESIGATLRMVSQPGHSTQIAVTWRDMQ